MQAGARRTMLSRQILETYDLFRQDPVCTMESVPRQGHCNDNTIVTTQKRRYIVRRLLRDDIDRDFEVWVHQSAYHLEITAELLLYDADQSVMVFAYLEGEHKKRLSYADLARMAGCLFNLHSINVPSSCKPLSMKTLLPDPLTHEVSEALAMVRKMPEMYALCHNDLNPYNIIWMGEEVKLIDFEYAAYTDIYFDLATICVEFKLSEAEEAYLLACYFGKRACLKEKLTVYKVLYRAVCDAWFKKNMQGTAP